MNYYAHERPYYDYTTANIYTSSKPIYHSCYPTDLIHPENMPITSDPFLGDYEKICILEEKIITLTLL